jgi:hypothetical protein
MLRPDGEMEGSGLQHDNPFSSFVGSATRDDELLRKQLLKKYPATLPFPCLDARLCPAWGQQAPSLPLTILL